MQCMVQVDLFTCLTPTYCQVEPLFVVSPGTSWQPGTGSYFFYALFLFSLPDSLWSVQDLALTRTPRTFLSKLSEAGKTRSWLSWTTWQLPYWADLLSWIDRTISHHPPGLLWVRESLDWIELLTMQPCMPWTLLQLVLWPARLSKQHGDIQYVGTIVRGISCTVCVFKNLSAAVISLHTCIAGWEMNIYLLSNIMLTLTFSEPAE